MFLEMLSFFFFLVVKNIDCLHDFQHKYHNITVYSNITEPEKQTWNLMELLK